MATLKTKRQPLHNRRVKHQADTQTMQTNWVKEYLHACFEHREVDVLPAHQREIELLLW